MEDYFLISVSNKHNLYLCMDYLLAGFPSSISGLWAYVDIEEGDYVSFLYGARIKNLYRVVERVVYDDANDTPPWRPILFKSSKRTYYFPFRLKLEQVRKLDEPLVRNEFLYVAENLLLRGGYKKTHFQADNLTFYNVSSMGEKNNQKYKDRGLNDKETIVPKIAFNKYMVNIPKVFYFHELILQSLIRKKLNEYLKQILEYLNIHISPEHFEILGEKGLSEGFVDIFIKLKHPQTQNIYIVVEVKKGAPTYKDFDQLKKYMEELGDECAGGVLVGKSFSKKLVRKTSSDVVLIEYSFKNISYDHTYTFEELLNNLVLRIL